MHKAENGRNEEGEQRAFKELAKNAVLSVMYDVQVPSNVETNKVLGSILVTNNCQKLVKELIFDVSKSSSLSLIKNVSNYETILSKRKLYYFIFCLKCLHFIFLF